MFGRLLNSIVTALLSVHASLYAPTFRELPKLNPPITQNIMEVLLAVPRASARSTPEIQAQAYLVIDQTTGEVLAEKNADMKLFPASTTKMMTALVAIESLELDKIASVGADIARDGRHMALMPGEQIRVRDLLAGLLIHSANDAAVVLSQQYEGGTDGFVQQMNATAQRLSMDNSHFTNPVGFSEEGHVMSVRDLLILAREVMKQEELARLVGRRSLLVTSVDKNHSHFLQSTNELFGVVAGLEGIKTGWTEEAGECLVAQATRGNQTLLTAVLGSPDRFDETARLLEWAFASYKLEKQKIE